MRVERFRFTSPIRSQKRTCLCRQASRAVNESLDPRFSPQSVSMRVHPWLLLSFRAICTAIGDSLAFLARFPHFYSPARIFLSAAKPQPKCATTDGPGPIPDVERRRPRRRQTPSSLASSGHEPSPLRPFPPSWIGGAHSLCGMTPLSRRKEVDGEWCTPSVHRAV